MDVSRRRAGVQPGVVAGSVWESRMRSDEVRGGIKVFNGDEKTDSSTENNAGNNANRAKRPGPVGEKRKTWKPESSDGPVPQVSGARAKAELSKNADEMVKELSVSADGPIKKSPAGAKRGKRDAVSGADQAVPRSPVQVRRSRSEAARGSAEKNSVELRKVKSDSGKNLDQSRRDGDDGKSEENAVRLSTANSEPPGVLDGSCQEDGEEEEEEEEEMEAEEKEAIDGPADVYEEEPDARAKAELSKNADEMAKELSDSADGPIQKSPAGAKRGKRDAVSGADQAVPRSPVQVRRSRSEAARGSAEKNSVELRKVKSDSGKFLDQSRRDGDDGKSEENAVRLSTANSGPPGVLDGWCQKEEEENEKEAIGGPADRYEEELDGESKSDEIRKEVISSDVSQVQSALKEAPREDENNSNVNETNDLVEEEEGEYSEELEEEEGDGEFDEDSETEPENKSLEIKEIVVTEKKASDVVVKEEKRPIQVAEKPKSISPIVKKQPPPAAKQTRVHRNIANLTPSKTFTSSTSSSNVDGQPSPVTRRSPLHQNFATKTNSFSDKYQSFPEKSFPERQNKLQSLVDLVMWRDVSKSAFIFGFGTFVVISSSYTKDISFSLITVVSYLGLFYLAAIFLYRSIVRRGYIDIDDTSCVLGEEEAIWLLKLVLPYLNEFLLKLKALFSGDPGTTMKLAVLLFVLARCGSSITIWKMAKFGFFGVFTVPKVCSSYSGQITAYGKFWIRRFRDAWNSCSHKKAVAAGIFTLVWNLCSVVARIWAVFMLYVAFRYYQQNLLREDWAEDNEWVDDKCHGQVGGPKNSRGPTIVESSKGKKAS